MRPETLELHDPWLLLLALPALALLIWSHRRRRAAPALLFPTVARFRGMRPSLRQRARILLPLLQAAAIVLLAVAAARPRRGDSRTVIRSEGIAIQMVIDRSSSMEEKMDFEGRKRSRMDIVKKVFASFVSGGGKLPGRKTDLIGLTTFARFTEESCPLVSQHEPLLTAVQNLTTVAPWLDKLDQPIRIEELPANPFDRQRFAESRQPRQNPLNATAIGDGLLRAVSSLVTAEEDLARGEEEGGYRIKGKVVILLTDGENNAGDVDPVEAGKYAAENGIRLYYILLQETLIFRETITGPKVVGTVSPDQLLEVPRKVAGDPSRAFLASDGDALLKIYEQIDQLERTEIGRVEYRSYRERYHWFLLPAVACALLAMFLGETWLRRIP